MNPTSIILYLLFGLVFFIIISIVVLAYYFRDDIKSFIWPHNYSEITMFESDNHVSTWLQKKNPDLRFDFNKGTYNMFTSSGFEELEEKIPDPNEQGSYKIIRVKKPIDKPFNPVYRSGRLSKFFYIEGLENPIVLTGEGKVEITGNPQITNSLNKTDLGKLFINEDSKFTEIWQMIMPFVIIGGFIILGLIILMSRKGG